MTLHSHTNRLAQENKPLPASARPQPGGLVRLGPEAFAAAEAQNKPILLSIGYSACHWCHVMERESFGDETIAGLMNQDFIISRGSGRTPDVDAIYMSAVQMLTGRAAGR